MSLLFPNREIFMEKWRSENFEPPPSDKDRLKRFGEFDFVPFGEGTAIQTGNQSRRGVDQDIEFAALIAAYNPLALSATKALTDTIGSTELVIQEKTGNTWTTHTNNPVYDFFEQPAPNLDKWDILTLYVSDLFNLGVARGVMFGKGDVLPDGSRVMDRPAFDFVLPSLLKKVENEFIYFSKQGSAPVHSDRVFNHYKDASTKRLLGEKTTPKGLLRVIQLHEFYLKYLTDFFIDGGIPHFLLIRRVDITKEGTISSIDQNTIDAQVEKLYTKTARKGRRKNLVGLQGDYELKELGSPIENILQSDLVHFIETLVSSVYGVPPSIFWAGLQFSNQRASRQMDGIDFYSRTINNLISRIETRFSSFFPPLLDGNKSRFRIKLSTEAMPLAQDVRLKRFRFFERLWQLQILNLGQITELLDFSTKHLTEEQKISYYKGGSANLNVGAGSQNVDSNNGLE